MSYFVALPDGNYVEVPDNVSQADAYKRIVAAYPQLAPRNAASGNCLRRVLLAAPRRLAFFSATISLPLQVAASRAQRKALALRVLRVQQVPMRSANFVKRQRAKRTSPRSTLASSLHTKISLAPFPLCAMAQRHWAKVCHPLSPAS